MPLQFAWLHQKRCQGQACRARQERARSDGESVACAFGKGIVTEEKHLSHSGSNLGGTAGERLQPHTQVVGSQAARISVSGLGPP